MALSGAEPLRFTESPLSFTQVDFLPFHCYRFFQLGYLSVLTLHSLSMTLAETSLTLADARATAVSAITSALGSPPPDTLV